jgi:FkbM family methyltransferase
MSYYSQGGEEPIIVEYFGDRTGRLLDCGAYDGRTFSNSLALIERGWGGVCVEPEPQSLEGLHQVHGDNPLITIIPMAVAERSGMVTFYNSGGGGVSTASEAHRKKWESAATFSVTEVQAISPAALLQTHTGPYLFFNLDIEGMNVELLELFPLSEMGVELLCVEHDDQDERVLSHCEKHGLTQVLYRSGENLIVAQ